MDSADKPEIILTAEGFRFWKLTTGQPGAVFMSEHTREPQTIITAGGGVLTRDEAREVAAALSAFAETGRLPEPGVAP